MLPKSVTLIDLERHRGPYFWVVSPELAALVANYVTLVEVRVKLSGKRT